MRGGRDEHEHEQHCVDDSDEALRVANNSSYGLSAGILTQDIEKAFCMAEKLEVGSVHINDAPLHGETHAPMGGVKNSGWGRFGTAALEDFTELRWVTMQKGKRQYPF